MKNIIWIISGAIVAFILFGKKKTNVPGVTGVNPGTAAQNPYEGISNVVKAIPTWNPGTNTGNSPNSTAALVQAGTNAFTAALSAAKGLFNTQDQVTNFSASYNPAQMQADLNMYPNGDYPAYSFYGTSDQFVNPNTTEG